MNGQEPPLGARLTTTWLSVYTRRLPADIAVARRDEVAADLHDHLADRGQTSTATVSREIAVRMLLGIPADLSWRTQQARAARSARHREIAMNDTPLIHRGRVMGLGVLTVAWGVIASTGSALNDVGNGSNDATPLAVWIAFAAATAVGVVGLLLLGRGHDIGAALVAACAVATTLPFYWMPPIPIAGLVLAGFFILHLRRQPSPA